jgi:toxin ParE1/3/4
MSRHILLDARAVQDLEEQADYIAADSLPSSVRFAQAVQAAFEQIRELPHIGRIRAFPNPRLAGIRQWRVPGFENYLIFYRPIEDGIEVLRVLHGARDVERLFTEEGEEAP